MLYGFTWGRAGNAAAARQGVSKTEVLGYCPVITKKKVVIVQGDWDVGGDHQVSTGDVFWDHQWMQTSASEEFENPLCAGLAIVLVL